MSVTDARELEAGPELDAEVAKKVMGWQHYPEAIGYQWVDPETDADVFGPPPFSTDIAAAWRVVERLRARGWTFNCYGLAPAECDPQRWHAVFHRGTSGSTYTATTATVSVAICRAALKAVDPWRPVGQIRIASLSIHWKGESRPEPFEVRMKRDSGTILYAVIVQPVGPAPSVSFAHPIIVPAGYRIETEIQGTDPENVEACYWAGDSAGNSFSILHQGGRERYLRDPTPSPLAPDGSA